LISFPKYSIILHGIRAIQDQRLWLFQPLKPILPIPPISITATSPIPIQNVHYHISEKLTQDNYSLWQYLMVPFLEGQNLFGHVDDTILQPPKLIPDQTSSLLILNPDHLPWYHQDRIIFSAIISTISVETLPHVGLSTAREV
jgi:hypothetical protein